ncbi:MAG: D-glycero-beta-D-manno-heptose 1,7-bisphosphate 7-phosphatase, partial [Arenicellales bacterium]
MDKWLILDRDGVINFDSDEFIKSPEEWMPLPGSLAAIAKLNQAGYRIVVISNQSGLARGLFPAETLTAIHQKMIDLLSAQEGAIEKIYFCPHGPKNDCDCRKPKSGLFERFALDYNIALTGVFAVGDSVRDLQAARAAGALPILVKTGKGLRSLAAIEADPSKAYADVPVYADLAHFV